MRWTRKEMVATAGCSWAGIDPRDLPSSKLAEAAEGDGWDVLLSRR